MSIKGNIFDIQRFSVHDGPGIRTTVFLKGCPLSCIWCHNPESQSKEISIAYYAKNCIGCGACAEACKAGCHSITADGMHVFVRDNCIGCGACAEACASDAMVAFGKSVTVDEVMSEVRRDKMFYKNSGGGMTVSGGEPLMQGEFLIELLRAARAEGIGTAIETSGFGTKALLSEVAKYTDLFLFDIKESNADAHKRLTGAPLSTILENLKLLGELGANIILRCPLIPGINVREGHLAAIASLAASTPGVKEINVMAYHTLGAGKYEALEMKDQMLGTDAMAGEEKKRIIGRISELLSENGVTDIPVL